MKRYSLNSCGIKAEIVTTIRIIIVILEAGEKVDSENPSALCFSAESIMH